jgi:heme a synthase
MRTLVAWLSWSLPVLALIVIVFGAYVRLTNAGLGCPDWPGCYGHLTVPKADSSAHLDRPEWQSRPLEVGKAWREMTHRYLASALGAGIVLLAFCAWRTREILRTSRVVYALVPLVIFQGMLGMWTVTLLLKPLIVCAHLLGGLATLALLWWNLLVVRGVRAEPPIPSSVRRIARIALAVLVIQIFLGGWTSANYAALACTDFPTCQGQWLPHSDFIEGFTLWRGLGINYEYGVLETPARTAIHLTHRIGALVTALSLLFATVLCLRQPSLRLRRAGWYILAAAVLQIALGVTNVLGGLPLAVAVGHNAGAALLLLSVLLLVRLTSVAAAVSRDSTK